MKKNKRKYRILSAVMFILSILSCSVPEIVAAFNVLPPGTAAENKIAIGGFTATVIAIMLIIIFRTLIAKYIRLIPYSLLVLAGFTALWLVLNGLSKVISEATHVAFVGLIGAVVAVVFDMLHLIFKAYMRSDNNE